MGTMSITDTKHVHRLTLLNIRSQNECILISLVWISGLKADPRSEGELLHYIFLLNMSQVRCVCRSRSHFGPGITKVSIIVRKSILNFVRHEFRGFPLFILLDEIVVEIGSDGRLVSL